MKKALLLTFLMLVQLILIVEDRTGAVVRQQPDRPFYAELSWSPDGSRIMFSAFQGKDADIFVMNPDGTGLRRITDSPEQDMWGSFSPDGRRIVFQSKREGPEDIYVMNADGSKPTRLTRSAAGRSICPSWSRDGSRIAFSSDRDGRLHVYTMKADGSAQVRLTPDTEAVIKYYNPVWSPDGKRIVLYTEKGDHKDQVQVMDADGSNPRVLTGNVGNNIFPSWSPDGKRILFTSNREGDNGAIYAVNADGSNMKELAGAVAASVARWSPNGKKIAFIAGDYPVSDIFIMNADGSGVTKLTR